ESYQLNNLMVKSNIVQFNDKRVLIYFEEQFLDDFIAVDLLYIRNNARVDLLKLRQNMSFKQVLLDASNHDWFIHKLMEEASIIDVPVYVLKNNFAYVW